MCRVGYWSSTAVRCRNARRAVGSGGRGSTAPAADLAGGTLWRRRGANAPPPGNAPRRSEATSRDRRRYPAMWACIHLTCFRDVRERLINREIFRRLTLISSSRVGPSSELRFASASLPLPPVLCIRVTDGLPLKVTAVSHRRTGVGRLEIARLSDLSQKFVVSVSRLTPLSTVRR
jgi:hypothetical protein